MFKNFQYSKSLSKLVCNNQFLSKFSTAASEPESITSSNALKYERITRKDHDEVMSFIEEHYFKDEPLTREMHLNGLCIEEPLKKFVESMVTQGMSVKCIDSLTGKNIVGVSINRLLTPNEAEKIRASASTCVSPYSRRLMEAWALMNSEPNLFKRFNDTEIFDIWLGCVRRDMRNMGIGKKLVKASLCLGRELNYEMASMDCTNKFSSLVAREMGMRLQWEYPFATVTKKKISCKFPHSHIQVFTKKLKANDVAKMCQEMHLVDPKDFLRH